MDIKKIRQKRLKHWFADKAIPQKEKSYLSQLINGKASFGERAARRLENTYGMPDKYLDQDLYDDAGNVKYVERTTNGRAYPLVSWVSAGSWLEAVEPYNENDIDEWPATTENVGDNAFWLTVTGDSMTAPSGLSIPEGMIILVDPSVEPKSEKLVVAKLQDENKATFRRYIVESGVHYLKPLNPQYRMVEINENCKIIGVVVDAKLANLP
ncbi:LexA family protein [Pragia fontium]|uniref:LexA family protein n=1 Tax=Pragia fontium TaxID=82985 RepID=UPI000F6BBF5F|nr:S24 family peptidase [Pragia fontium]VEJ54593.1 Uncharacterized HTH-type transcriptional regulator CBU_1416 [Pragia fontium]